MPSAKSGTLSFADLRASGLVRPAAEKFAGAWLACFLVMTRSDVLRALSFEHVLRASVCGTVGAAVAVALLAQMDRTTNSLARQVTISSIATFAGDIFAHPSHFPPNGRSRWSRPRYQHALPSPFGMQRGGQGVLREGTLIGRCPLLRVKRTCAVQLGMSALPPKADMCGATRDVRFVP